MAGKYSSRRQYTQYNKKAKKRWWHKPAKKAGGALAEVGVAALKKVLGLNTENKNWDTNPGGTVPSILTQFSVPTQNLAQGTSPNQRNGNSLRITHYKIRGTLQTTAPNFTFQRVRVIFTLQRRLQPPGSLVTPIALLQNSANIDSPYNTDLEGVQVLWDKTFLIKPYTTQLAQLPFKFKYSPAYAAGHVQWTDADVGGLNANLVEGGIQMFLMTDQLANQPTFSAYARLHFVDN